MSKSKIVRTPTRVEGGLTPDEEVAMQAHAEMWIRRIMRTDPIEPDKIIPAIKALYAAADLDEPRVIIVPSPLAMALAGGAARAYWDQYRAATRAATRDATRAATYTATYAATRDATDAATRAATDTATRAATYAATYAATRAATYTATYAATRDATDAATRAATDDWWRYTQGGNMWGQHESYLTAFRDVLRLRLPEYDRYAAWEQAATHGGYRYMHPKFCIVSDFPEFIHTDAQYRPHCETGPSHRWRDGWSLYHWHGVRVPDWVIEHPERITGELVLTEPNTEVRAAMLQRRPLALTEILNVKVLHEDTVSLDPIEPPSGILPRLSREIEDYAVTHPRPTEMRRKLIQVPMPDTRNGWIKAIVFEDPAESGAMGVLFAHRDSKTCQDAVARSYGLTVEDYPTEIESRRR